MEHEELTAQIIGAAHKVLYALKPGLDEKLYERAMVIELTAQGLRCESQKQFLVHYGGQHIGTLIPDLIVEEKVLVDAKVVSAFTDTHLAQMLGYLHRPQHRPSSQLQTRQPRHQTRRQPMTTTECAECTEGMTPERAGSFHSVHSAPSVVTTSIPYTCSNSSKKAAPSCGRCCSVR